jgi:arginase
VRDLRPVPTLLGLPYDASSSFLRGASAGPAAIRAALRSPAGNPFTESLRDLSAADGLADAGDLTLPEEAAEARRRIGEGVAGLRRRGGRPIALGGDHSVSYPVVRALAEVDGPLAVLHIDAHPDLYDHLEGDRWSHACPFARLLEEGWVRRLVQVGIRAMTRHQQEQAARFGVEVIDLRAWVAGRRPDLAGIDYVSVDLDGIDPAFAPGVAHPEPGGLTSREVLTLLQALPAGLRGADVVELNPSRDLGGITALLAAKLVEELADRMLAPG